MMEGTPAPLSSVGMPGQVQVGVGSWPAAGAEPRGI